MGVTTGLSVGPGTEGLVPGDGLLMLPNADYPHVEAGGAWHSC